MNKNIFLVLLVGLFIVFAASARWGRGWGGHRWGGWGGWGRPGIGFSIGFGRPYGYGYGYGWPYYGYGYRPYYYGDYYSYSRPRYYYVEDSSDSYDDEYTDSRGKKYWEVFNDTPYTITFIAEGHDPRRVNSGQTRNIPHEYGLNFDIKSNSGYGVRGSASQHRLRIIRRDKDGKIAVKKS